MSSLSEPTKQLQVVGNELIAAIKETNIMSQAEIQESLLTSTGFYSLFQTLPLEIRQDFLQLLFQNNSTELEDSILYLACENYRKEGFLSDLDSQSLLESLPRL